MAAQNQKSDSSDGLITLLMIVGILYFLHWYIQDEWKYGRLILFKYYINGYNFIFDLIGFKPDVIAKAHEYLYVYDPKEISTDVMKKMAQDLYMYVSAPFLAIIAFIFLGKMNKSISYNRIFTRRSLVHDQKQKWSWLHPVADLDLEPEVEKGEWAMAKRPLNFVKKYQLLDENNNLIEEKASVIFSEQMGTLFNGFENMKPYEQALMTIFAAHSLMSKESKKDAYKWLSILNITHKNPDYSWVKEGWEKYKNSDKVREALTQHAYNKTVLMRMLENARGVLPTSYFVWLKKTDRTLFFSLNCLGRKEHFAECAGVINHFFAEKTLGKPMLKQYVLNAIAGLKYAITHVKITNENYYNLDE